MPMPELEDEGEWEIKEVKGKEARKGDTLYLVKWTWKNTTNGWPKKT